MIVIWRGAGCLAFLLGIGLLALAAFVGFGVILGLAALLGGLLCWAAGSQDAEGESSHLYFIPLKFWGMLFTAGGVLLIIWGVFRWLTSGLPQLSIPELGWGWWAAGWTCGGVVVLAVVAVVVFAILDAKKKNRVLRDGDHTFAWLVHATDKLFQDGILDGSAVVLITPESLNSGGSSWMAELAGRVAELKGRHPDECGSGDQAVVAGLLRDETYTEGKRDRLPDLFTHGREVYLAHLYVYRDHLPAKHLDCTRIACAVLWHQPDSLICTRP